MGFNLFHAAGSFVKGFGGDLKGAVSALGKGDIKGFGAHLGGALSTGLGIPGAGTQIALLTGGNPIAAAKKDLTNFSNSAKLAEGVSSGNPAAIFNAATNNGYIKDAGLVPPAGASYKPGAVDVTGLTGAALQNALVQNHPILAIHALGQGPMADAAMLAAAKTASLTAPPPSLVAKLLPFAPVAAGVILWPAIGVIGPVLGAIGTGLWFWEDRQT